MWSCSISLVILIGHVIRSVICRYQGMRKVAAGCPFERRGNEIGCSKVAVPHTQMEPFSSKLQPLFSARRPGSKERAPFAFPSLFVDPI